MLIEGRYSDTIRLDPKAWHPAVEAQVSDRGTVKLTQHVMGRDVSILLTAAEFDALVALHEAGNLGG